MLRQRSKFDNLNYLSRPKKTHSGNENDVVLTSTGSGQRVHHQKRDKNRRAQDDEDDPRKTVLLHDTDLRIVNRML